MYISTRNNSDKVKASQAIKTGMVPQGGLYVPENIPLLDQKEIYDIKGSGYNALAVKILTLFLDDYTQEEVAECVNKAYNKENFLDPDIAPIKKLDNDTFIMELWHGPTAAFKDIALQIMPYLLVKAIAKTGTVKETVILVATSGDTGKAALEGFRDVPGIRIIVFYPYEGVSKVQELQMNTTEGNNTSVVAVRGNFDDCQQAVKNIFADPIFRKELESRGFELSSANSINWGRLLPQIVYYFHAYLDLLAKKAISEGEKINFVVPTGNFGNILAGWYAQAMGLPINKLICASNENNVLTDFFTTGSYKSQRPFIKTVSPSMDILISSNLERFLFEITDHDGDRVKSWMDDLAEQGSFEVQPEYMKRIGLVLSSGWADETKTLDTIRRWFDRTGYVLDTHTAVGVQVYEDYCAVSGDRTKTIIDATASPFKFNTSVLKAIKGDPAVIDKNEIEILHELSKVIKQPVHPSLLNLDKKTIRHKRVCAKEEIKTVLTDILGI